MTRARLDVLRCIPNKNRHFHLQTKSSNNYRGESDRQKIHAPVTNVKCRHQSNYRFLSGGNEGTTTTTTSTRVERRGEKSTGRVCRGGTGGSAPKGKRSNFKCKVLSESGFQQFREILLVIVLQLTVSRIESTQRYKILWLSIS